VKSLPRTQRCPPLAEFTQLEQEFDKTVTHVAVISDNLKAALSAKDMLLFYIFYELRVPLRAVSVAIEELLTSADCGVGTFRDLLGTSAGQVDQAVSIVDDMLFMSRLEAGALELEMGPMSVAAVIDRALRCCRLMVDERHIEVVNQTALNDFRVFADRRRLEHILFHLISNACKFVSRDTGRVELQADLEDWEARAPERYSNLHAIPIHESGWDRLPSGAQARLRQQLHRASVSRPEWLWLVIKIRDNGVGIADEDVKHIFQAYQLFRAGSEQVGGSGLGLSISQRIAELHGGWIEVETLVGRGSTFLLAVPVVRCPPDLPPSPLVSPPSIAKHRRSQIQMRLAAEQMHAIAENRACSPAGSTDASPVTRPNSSESPSFQPLIVVVSESSRVRGLYARALRSLTQAVVDERADSREVADLIRRGQLRPDLLLVDRPAGPLSENSLSVPVVSIAKSKRRRTCNESVGALRAELTAVLSKHYLLLPR